MDDKGAGRDNVLVERIWKSVKYEEVYLRACSGASDARTSIGRYLAFYSGRRPHQSLGRQTPDQACFIELAKPLIPALRQTSGPTSLPHLVQDEGTLRLACPVMRRGTGLDPVPGGPAAWRRMKGAGFAEPADGLRRCCPVDPVNLKDRLRDVQPDCDCLDPCSPPSLREPLVPLGWRAVHSIRCGLRQIASKRTVPAAAWRSALARSRHSERSFGRVQGPSSRFEANAMSLVRSRATGLPACTDMI